MRDENVTITLQSEQTVVVDEDSSELLHRLAVLLKKRGLRPLYRHRIVPTGFDPENWEWDEVRLGFKCATFILQQMLNNAEQTGKFILNRANQQEDGSFSWKDKTLSCSGYDLERTIDYMIRILFDIQKERILEVIESGTEQTSQEIMRTVLEEMVAEGS